MPRYNYECRDCLDNVLSKHEIDEMPGNIYESEVLFETSHSMNPTEKELFEAIECPRCGGHNCEKSYHDCNIHAYIRGYGWLDKPGISRDMNKHTLLTNDPYAKYRTPGEVEHIKSTLEKSGKHNPNTKYYPVKTSDVEKVVK